MSKRRVPIPKTQSQVQRDSIKTYDSSNVPVPDKRKKRANQKRVDDVDIKPFNIGLKDIDETIVYYFDNVIKPSVFQNGTRIQVPLLYGSPERWNSVQKNGFYRDKNGKILTPLIMFKRDSVEKNRTLGNKLDANNPTNYVIFSKKYSSKNYYDKFSSLVNRDPVKEYFGVVIPDYVNITYSCIIFTDYVEQMNKIIEGINYASDSYWGDPERFKFRASIDNYSTAVDLSKGQDRAVKTTFSINLFGYVIPDTINTELLGARRSFSKSRVSFKIETVKNRDELLLRSKTPEKDSTRRFYDSPGLPPETGPSLEEIIFLSTSNFAMADQVTLNQAIFLNKTIFTPPPGYSLDEDSFSIFVNGVSITPQHVLIQQTGTNITATFNSSLMGYSVEPSDSVLLTGKFK